MIVSDLRQAAREIWEAALAAADPETCIRNALSVTDNALLICGQDHPLSGKLYIIGAGKASARMAQVVEAILGPWISAGIVVTRYGQTIPLKRIRVVEAGHPIPDVAGVRAIGDTRCLLAGLQPQDIVLCLLSGGGSALWPAPAPGITLGEKQAVTQDLLNAGATIRELNGVRKHLSAVKGGQLMEWAAPATVVSLIMSDVIGDSLDSIASGPTAPDESSFAEALATLRKYAVAVPAAVAQRFEAGIRGDIAETPKPQNFPWKRVENHIIATNRLLVDAAEQKARALGFKALILGCKVEGEAREVGQQMAAVARQVGRAGNPVQVPACVLAAGETTVTVEGDGKGGRNQEMALSWAIAMADHQPDRPCCFASVATDGSDGPTLAAGGLVDPATCARGLAAGLDPLECLRRNDSSTFLSATGDRIITGPTQTNLMDLQILLVGDSGSA